MEAFGPIFNPRIIRGFHWLLEAAFVTTSTAVPIPSPLGSGGWKGCLHRPRPPSAWRRAARVRLRRKRAKLVVIADIVIRIVIFGCKHQQHPVARVAVLGSH